MITPEETIRFKTKKELMYHYTPDTWFYCWNEHLAVGYNLQIPFKVKVKVTNPSYGLCNVYFHSKVYDCSSSGIVAITELSKCNNTLPIDRRGELLAKLKEKFPHEFMEVVKEAFNELSQSDMRSILAEASVLEDVFNNLKYLKEDVLETEN